MNTIRNNNLTNMSKKAKDLFVKLWIKEHALCVESNKVYSDIEIAELKCLSTTRLNSKYNSIQKKINAVNDIINNHVKSGLFPEDAATQCAKELGRLSGYVADCFHCAYQDYKPD